MKKAWNVKPLIKNEVKEQHQNYNPTTLQLLYSRNIVEAEAIEKFLDPKYPEDLCDPKEFNDIDEAVKLVIKHIKKGSKITIYGDYDADGVTSSALMYDVLTTLKANVDVYIPHRVKEGYGLNKNAVKFIGDNGTDLIITVDGGIRNKEEVALAKKLGMEIVITDHHIAPEEVEELPECPIINPVVEGEKYPYKKLAGAGVAFKFASAIIGSSKLSQDNKEKLINSMLDLVAIGTTADCVSLIGENRVLVKEGLVYLNKTKKKGLKKLIKIASIRNKELSAWNIGFQIAPRLNAAGRMEHANTAYKLLVTKDDNEAKNLANELNQNNISRQDSTEGIFRDVEAQIGDSKDNKIIIGTYAFSENEEEEGWNEGIIGLVAGRICEKYYKPTLVITKTEEGYKGSGRSIDGFNLINAIEQCSELLDKYGGHPAACGFSLKEENLGAFQEKITKISNEELSEKHLVPTINIDAEITLGEVNEEMLEELQKFEPFGQDNEKPKFVSYNVDVADMYKIGNDGKHLKFRLRDESSDVISAVAFSMADEWGGLEQGDVVDIVYYIELNEYNGRREVQLRLVDIRRAK